MANLQAMSGHLLATGGHLAADPACCCCGPCNSGTTPENLTVVITGAGPWTAGAGGCANCADFNGTYVLAWTLPEWEGIGCFYTYNLPTPICGTTQMGVILKPAYFGINVLVYFAGEDSFGDLYEYYTNGSLAQGDCDEISGLTLGYPEEVVWVGFAPCGYEMVATVTAGP